MSNSRILSSRLIKGQSYVEEFAIAFSSENRSDVVPASSVVCGSRATICSLRAVDVEESRMHRIMILGIVLLTGLMTGVFGASLALGLLALLS